MQLHGFHHLTAVSASIRENLRFYTGTMGMRLVKRSVNQDDVSAYHLFYADAVGSPGTDLTFFDWDMAPERRGTHTSRPPIRHNGHGNLHPVLTASPLLVLRPLSSSEPCAMMSSTV